MNHEIPCLLLTRDAALAQRLRGALSAVTDVTAASDVRDVQSRLAVFPGSMVLIDLAEPGASDALPALRRERPEALVLAIGVPRSDPLLFAESLGVYAVESRDAPAARFSATVRQALDHLRLAEELRLLRTERPGGHHAGRPAGTDAPARGAALRELLPPLRHFENVDNLLRGVVDGIAGTGLVLRAGVFTSSADRKTFRLRAGFGCTDAAGALSVRGDDPLVGWLELNAQMVHRSALRHVDDLKARLMLQHSLEAMGADLIVPMRGQRALLGWFVLGRRASGLPFDEADLRDVMVFADHVAMALENAMLYEVVSFQKTFAETLLHSIATGIVAAGEDGAIYWVSDAATRILGLKREEIMGEAVERLGSRVASSLRSAMAGEASATAQTWVDPETRRFLSLQTARLLRGNQCLGVVAFLHDLTPEKELMERQRQQDRTAFWTELAANLAHELRNPLVAIKTFSQLLPERYADPDFRETYSSLIPQEVDRLDAIVRQINAFADVSQPVFEKFDLREAVRDGLELARFRVPQNGVQVRTSAAPDVPMIVGDRRSLTESFSHLVANALEALRGKQDNPQVEIALRPVATPELKAGVEVSVRDNGGGIDPLVRDRLFSPFCSTKGRSLGLGLPIAQRTAMDHSGQLRVDTNDKGTTVTMVLPTDQPDAEKHK